MEKAKIIEKIEASAHVFLMDMKAEYKGDKVAGMIIHKYIREGAITPEEEHILKTQMMDSLKMAGVVVPFVLVPGASILMPILIKVADKHNIELLPAAFNNKSQDNK